MPKKTPADRRKKRLALIGLLGLVVIVIYVPVLRSVVSPEDRVVPEDVPEEGNTGDFDLAELPEGDVDDGGDSRRAFAQARPSDSTNNSGQNETGIFDRLSKRPLRRKDSVENEIGAPVLQGILYFGEAPIAIVDGDALDLGERGSRGWIERIGSRSIRLRSREGSREIRFPVVSNAASPDEREATTSDE